jgi:hypothetical protein
MFNKKQREIDKLHEHIERIHSENVTILKRIRETPEEQIKRVVAAGERLFGNNLKVKTRE